jgi:hypothetical protein
MINARRGLNRLFGEFAELLMPAVEAVRRRCLRCLWLGPAAALIVGCLALAFRTPRGHSFLLAYAITRPGDPLATTVVKLPLSMFAPAALLPFWFAVAQVGVVYSVAQSLIGARRTILTALAGHVLGTFSAHLWIVLGRPLGVGHGYDHFGDAGPSVAVVAVIAYIAVAHRVSWLVIGMIAYHATEVGLFNGLSQREHLIGTLSGVLAAIVTRGGAAAGHAAPPVPALAVAYDRAPAAAPLMSSEGVFGPPTAAPPVLSDQVR